MSDLQRRKRRSSRTASQQALKLTKKQRRELEWQEEIHQEQLAEVQLTAKRRIIKRLVGWSGLLGGLILAVLGMVYFTASHKPEAGNRLVQPISSSGWTLGNPDAPITLVEYSDYQCPSCALYHDVIKEATEEVGDEFHFIFRHYPLRNHANAKLAARSAEAAGCQGKFWEMHHLIFVGQKQWTEKAKSEAERIFASYATFLGLDRDQFQGDLHSQEIINKVNSDRREGEDAGVTGTPTFFLNGQKVARKPRPYYGEFKAFILQSKIDDQ